GNSRTSGGGTAARSIYRTRATSRISRVASTRSGHLARGGYSRLIYHDHNRRVISMLINFCDQDEAGMRGGELVLHQKRFARWIRPAVTIHPRHNLIVAFPCSKRS